VAKNQTSGVIDIKKDLARVIRLSARIVYLALAISIAIGSLYIVVFPGTTNDEQFERFMIWSLLLWASILLSAPVFPYVVWKLAKRERPIFWGVALVIAMVPMLELLVIVIVGL
jgi:hypothetical protein